MDSKRLARLCREFANILTQEGKGAELKEALSRLVSQHTASSELLLWLGKDRSDAFADILGPAESGVVLDRARKLYQETVDSIRRDTRPAAQRAARSIGHFRFDPTSFSITAPNGTLMIAFSAPGQGSGGEGFTLPMRPIPVTEPAWWRDARVTLPTSTREREELWARGAYVVKAVYDTASRPVQLSILDSAGHEFPVGGLSSPVHRIYWLDKPPVDRTQRSALSRAFDEAASYGESVRAAMLQGGTSLLRLASRS